jgi:hypothetical protein
MRCPLRVVVVAMLLVPSAAFGQAERNRAEFAKALATLREGMSAKDVLAKLGNPDDLRTASDGPISTNGTKEIWRWGTNGHLTFATLGQVYLTEDGKVQYVFGASGERGEPPATTLLPEAQLVALLRTLDETPPIAGPSFNPRRLIEVVNTLQPLGKEKALAAIGEYARVASSFHDEGKRTGLFLVLRVLFEVPEDTGAMPAMMIGASSPAEPEDPRTAPRFPVTIEGDVPFLLVNGYRLAGVAEPVEEHIEFFREHGKLRGKPLAPTDKPAELVSRVMAHHGSLYGEGSSSRWENMFVNQVLALVETVQREEPDDMGLRLPLGTGWQAHWTELRAQIGKLSIHWDGASHRYVFADGSSMKVPAPVHYTTETWSPAGAALSIKLTRKDEHTVELDIGWKGGAPDFKVRLVAGPKELAAVSITKGTVSVTPGLVHQEMDATVGDEERRATVRVPLEVSAEVALELATGGKVQTSPAYKP